MDIVMSIKEKWAEKIYSGEKKIEWRKSWPNFQKVNYKDLRVYLYEVEKKLVTGFFILDHVEFYGPIFSDYETPCIKDGCISAEELKKYSNGKDLYMWHIKSAEKLGYPTEIKYFTPAERAPQSWCYTRAYFFNGTFNFDHRLKEFNK
jgi:predicted transcriptional regulator